MRISLKASLLLMLGLIHPVNMSYSTPPEDLEGSGYDPDTDDSPSGDWPEEDDMKNMKDLSNSTDVRIYGTNAGGGTKKSSHGSSVLTFDNKHWPAKDSEPGFVVVANSKSFLERKEVFAGVIAGGVIGVMLAAALAGILIYKWQKKDDRGYFQGQQGASDEDYHKANREEVFF